MDSGIKALGIDGQYHMRE